jgi:transcriptional regulator with XRE-family HTH domain
LEPYIGTRARVSEILNRQRPLTLRMIRNLEKGLGIPAAILVQDYELAPDHPPEKAEPVEDPDAASQANEAWHPGIEQPAVA